MGERGELTVAPAEEKGGRKARGKTRKKRRDGRGRGGFKVKIHPLFLLLGVWYCFSGELPAFLLSALVALQHECAHAFAAAKLGYGLNRIVLMPYGAVIDGDLRGIGFRDEIFVAVCGPLCNLLTAAAFTALWWLFPTAYAFTDSACFVSLAVAVVNLIPAYPLDGGRVLKCAVALKVGERKAERLCRALTFSFSAVLLALFVASLVRGKGNFSLLAFALFLFAGALGNPASELARYDKIDFSYKEAFRRGVEIRRVAVDESCTLGRAVGFVSRGRYLILDVYDERENYLGEIGQNELAELFVSSGIYEKIGKFV